MKRIRVGQVITYPAPQIDLIGIVHQVDDNGMVCTLVDGDGKEWRIATDVLVAIGECYPSHMPAVIERGRLYAERTAMNPPVRVPFMPLVHELQLARRQQEFWQGKRHKWPQTYSEAQ